MSSLVIQTSFLGDVVLTTPLLGELARRGAVTCVVTPQAAPLLEHHPAVTRLVVYDKRGKDNGAAGFLRLARQVAAASDDAVAYLAQGSHRSGALAQAAGYRHRVGFATSAGRFWYTERRALPSGTHHAARLLSLADPAAATSAPPRPALYPTAAHAAEVDVLLAGVDEPLVALAPGSVWATKRWGGFPELARALGVRPVVVGALADRPLALEILAQRPDAIDATGRLSLLGSAALLARCQAVVTNDSLPLHLASAMNTPTVALFGPTVPTFGFGPLSARTALPHVSGLPCRPCHAHGPMSCPLSHFRCMRDLTPGDVVAALAGVLR
jgi:heptosyltransferase II